MIPTLSEIAAAIGESISASVIYQYNTDNQKKKKLKRLLEDISEDCIQKFITENENEKYYFGLDNILTRDKFIEKVIQCFFSVNLVQSTDRMVEDSINTVIKEYPDLRVFQKQMEEAAANLKNDIIKILKESSLVEDSQKIIFMLQEESRKSIDRDRVLLNKMELLSKKFDTITGYKSENPEESSNYKELYRIFESCVSAYEKEMSIINWISNNSDIKEGLVILAYLYRNEKNFERAVYFFEYVADHYPEELDLYNNSGCIYLSNNDDIRAEAAFKKVLSKQEDNVNALYNMSIVYYNKSICKIKGLLPSSELYRYMEKSIDYINKAYELTTEDTDIMNFRAYLLMITRKDLNESLLLLNRAIELEEDIDFYINRAICFLIRKEFDEAIKEANHILEMELEEEGFVYSLLGNIYGMKGVEKREIAISMFQKSYEISHDDKILNNISNLAAGRYFDHVYLNGVFIEIYTFEELLSGSDAKQ